MVLGRRPLPDVLDRVWALHVEMQANPAPFLEDQLRERPLPTLLLGVLAGWIAGKLLR